MSRPDPHRALIAAIEDRYGELAHLISQSRCWASATFTGARHVLSFDVDAEVAEHLAASIADTELPMPGHFVADIAVMSRVSAGGRDHLTVDVLTVEE